MGHSDIRDIYQGDPFKSGYGSNQNRYIKESGKDIDNIILQNVNTEQKRMVRYCILPNHKGPTKSGGSRKKIRNYRKSKRN